MRLSEEELDFLKKHQVDLKANRIKNILADYKAFGSYKKLYDLLQEIGPIDLFSAQAPKVSGATSISIPTIEGSDTISKLLGSESKWVYWLNDVNRQVSGKKSRAALYSKPVPQTREANQEAPVYNIITFPGAQLGNGTIADEYGRIPTIGQVFEIRHAKTKDYIGLGSILSNEQLLIFPGEEDIHSHNHRLIPLFRPFDINGNTNVWEECSLKKEQEEAFAALINSKAFDPITISFFI